MGIITTIIGQQQMHRDLAWLRERSDTYSRLNATMKTNRPIFAEAFSRRQDEIFLGVAPKPEVG